jgi:hypothetical protein
MCASGQPEKADHIVDNWKLYNWVDLAQFFRDVPIVIKGCFKFGLKEIASSMYKHGMISLNITSNCKNGLEAAYKAWQAYQNEQDLSRNEDIKDIVKYNRFDVEVLSQILNYLRRNH